MDCLNFNLLAVHIIPTNFNVGKKHPKKCNKYGLLKTNITETSNYLKNT